ncbi:MAG: hypothetical protein IAA16_10630 [Candidatus Treponema excrementipullorum]|uniref:Lipoprotein n=1 Tax=Candidatus Treponema excrementipullorum TaxID=2838768 RepID=A0A9E2NZU9_9SPIR|nr:hypothetical protein [Candidatus Treponema excrementipullorum]
MKKNSVYGFMLVAFCLVLVSCGNLFSKVHIKAKPSIYAPLGKEEFKMSTYISVEKIQELLGGKKEEGTDSSEGGTDFPFKIYDYDGDKDGALAFRLYYPLMDFDLDFGNYLEGMDLSSFKTAIPKIDFTVPTLDGLSVENQTLVIPGTEGFSGTLDEQKALLLNETLKNTDPQNIDNKTIPITGSGLKSVKFASANNTITMTLKPTLEGMTCTPSINIALPDGVSIPFAQSKNGDPDTYVADFGGQTITPGDLTIGGAVTLGGSVEAGEPVPPEGIGVKIAFDIGFDGGFESATVAVPEGANFNHSVDFKFPEEAKKMVENVVFEEDNLGIIMSVVSTLPTDNNITISMDAFGGAIKGEQTIEPNSPGDDKPKNIEFKNSSRYTLDPSKAPFSATIKVTPPGYDSASNTMTIKNVAPGASYSLSGEAKIIANWESITLKDTATDPFEGSFPAAGAEPIDLSKFTELLPKEIAFKDIGAALFISSPLKKDDSQTDLSFTGEVSISGGDGGSIDLVGKDDTLTLLAEPIALPAEGKVWSGDLPTPSADMGKEITDFLNSRPTSLNLNYSLSLGNGTKIERADIPEDGKTSVKAEIVITLPIKLSVTQNAEFDVFALANIPTDKDLFGRTEAPATNEQINDLLEMLTSLNIGIDYNNNLGVALGAKVHLLTDKDGKPTLTKDFILEKGKNTYNLELTGEQIKQVMEAYPFCPRVYVELPSEDGDVVLEREGGIDLSLGVTAVTDINYTYDLKGGN